MPENYNNLLLPDSQTILDTKISTQLNFERLFNQTPNVDIPQTDLGKYLESKNQITNNGLPNISFEDALTSDNEDLRNTASSILDRSIKNDPRSIYNTDFKIETPMDLAGKYMDKTFGFDPLVPDMEDYYYRNDYLAENPIKRALITNPSRFIGRVITQAPLKFLEGIGYVGAMLGSIGSSNYWADVADNSFSKALEGAEQYVKDQLIPVYHEAGFDKKGFLSKLLDGTFWTDSVADSTAFMVSAFIPSLGIGQLGKIGAVAGELNAFGRQFGGVAGNILGKVGLGSGQELATWTLNTAMEAAQEGAGVFKDSKKNLLALRERGIEGYKNLTDQEIDHMAGNTAANTIAQNFLVLGLSNAYENTLFFKRGPSGTDVKLGSNFFGESKALAGLESKNPFASSLSKTRYYGSEAIKGLFAEGLWEENAQLAIQRYNTIDENGVKGDKQGIVSRYFSQIKGALAGTDAEAAESIGLGALIGIGAGTIFSKVHGERKEQIKETRRIIDEVNKARTNLFDMNDVYQRDSDNKIKFDENKQPVIDTKKLKAKEEAINKLFTGVSLANLDEFRNNRMADFHSKLGIAAYVRSLNNIGIKNISQRLENLTPENASIFGIDPSKPNEKIGEYKTLVESFQRHSDNIDDQKFADVSNISAANKALALGSVKSQIYQARSSNEIISRYSADEQSNLLNELNKNLNLQNTSLSQFNVNQLNSLVYKRDLTKKIIESDVFTNYSDIKKKYYTDRLAELDSNIEAYKKENELTLQGLRSVNDYYIAKNNAGDEIKLSDSASRSFKKVAEYENSIAYNNFIDTYLSDHKNWYENNIKLNSNKIIQEAEKAEESLQKSSENNIFSKYQEQNPGDFAKIVDLVDKAYNGKDITELQDYKLYDQYTDLFNEVLTQYQTRAKELAEKSLQFHLNNLQSKRDNLIESLFSKNYQLLAEKRNIEKLIEDIQNLGEEDKIKLKDLHALLQNANDLVENLKSEIEADEKRLERFDDQISNLELELQNVDVDIFRNQLNYLKSEREGLVNLIEENKKEVSRIEKLIRKLLKIAKELFPSFDFKKLGKILDVKQNPEWAKQNRKNYDIGIIESFDEIKSLKDQKKNLLEVIEDYKKAISDLNGQIARIQSDVDAVNKIIIDSINSQWQELTGTKGTADSEGNITEGFNSEISIYEPPISTGSEEQKYSSDNSDFKRPLTTKFFTSTFQDERFTNLTDNEKSHFELLNTLSDATKRDEVNKKLGKGKLRVIAVTRENVDKLGLKSILYTDTTETGIKDNTKYWEDPNTDLATVALVHVVEENGKLFYIDKDLNRIGELSKPNKNIVYTLLSASRFKESETPEYLSDKYGVSKMDIALTAGQDFRKELFETSKKFDIVNPNNVFSYNITRGILNRQENADNTVAKNPIPGILIDEKDINGDSIMISKTGDAILNMGSITLPVGKAFLKTKAQKEQLHYIDANKLNESQVETVLQAFYQLTKGYVSKVEEITKSNLSELTPGKRRDAIIAANKSKVKKFDKDLFQFLNSIVHVSTLKKEKIVDEETNSIIKVWKNPTNNQIYIKGDKIYFGKIAIDLTNPEAILENPEVRSFIESIYHNIKTFKDSKEANKPYTEYIYNKSTNTLETREWKTYAHYLLLDRNPDGSKRSSIPVTTQIKNKEQQKLSDKQRPYLGQSIILDVKYAEGAEKAIKETNNKGETDYSDELSGEYTIGESYDLSEKKQPVQVGKSLLDQVKEKMGLSTNQNTEQNERKEERGQEGLLKKEGSLLAAVKAKMAEEAQQASEKPVQDSPVVSTDDVTPAVQTVVSEDDADVSDEEITNFTAGKSFMSGTDIDSAFRRVTTTGPFETEEDLNSVIEEASKLLPQFTIIRLKKAIQTMDGGEAFGQFLNNVISIWEGGEKGTLYHEMFEGVANRILSEPEWNSMVKEFKAREGSFVDRETSIPTRFKDATIHQIKEQLAEEFRDYKLTGKLPAKSNTRTFFQVILDFIRNIFNNRQSIADIFQSINEGKFANRGLRPSDRFKDNYSRILPIPAKDYYNYIQGATAFMFREIAQSPGGLANLDEVGDVDNVIYEKIKSDIDAIYSELRRQTLPKDKGGDALYAQTSNDLKKNEENKSKLKQLVKASKDWEAVKANWGAFVRNHKIYMRHLSVKFNEEYNLSDEENDNRNRNDYTGNDFKISAKNNASTSVKFLVGTLMKSYSDNILITNNQIFPNLKYLKSSANLPQLVNYDQMMVKVLNKLRGANTVEAIKVRLEELSGINKLKNADNKSAEASVLTDEQNTFALLYKRLFHNNFSPDDALKLKIKFLSYSAKQTPTPHILMIKEDGAEIVKSVDRPAYELFLKRIEGSMAGKANLVFDIKRRGDKKLFVSKIDNVASIEDFLSKKESTGSQNIKKFIEFLGLGKVITREFILSLDEEHKNELSRRLLQIRNALKGVSFEDTINLRNANIKGYIDGENGLIRYLDRILPIATESLQFFNGDNEKQSIHVQPSFISRSIDNLNNATSLTDLIENNPNLGTSWAEDSIILEKMFKNNGTRSDFMISHGYIEGIKNLGLGKFKKSSRLEEHMRLGLEFIMNLEGHYYSLPADSETEWTFNFGEFVSFSDNFLEKKKADIINRIFMSKLKSEINTIYDFSKFNSSHQLNQPNQIDNDNPTPEDDKLIGQSLRFFKNMLSNKTKERIYAGIEKNTPAEKIISGNSARIVKDIDNYLKLKTENTINNLKSNRLIYLSGEVNEQKESLGTYKIDNLTTNLIQKFGASTFTEQGIRDIVAYAVVNSHIGNMEMFKLFFGDVAQYEDWEKRVKSLFSPVEQAFYDESGEINEMLKTTQNRMYLQDSYVQIPANDMFFIDFRNELNSRTIDDIEVVDIDTYNSLVNLNKELAKEYEDINEVDGQSFATIQAGKHLSIKAGWRWTNDNEKFYQYDTALARKELSEEDLYTYTSEELRLADLAILDMYKDDIPTSGINPYKTLIPSVLPDGSMVLLKHSIYFISWQLAKDRQLKSVYLDMLNRKDDVINFKSAQKVGLQTDDNNQITSYFNREGENINPFVTTDLVGVNNKQFPISFKTLGVQVETQGSKFGQTLGTQLTKDAFLNLMPQGVPLSFSEKYEDKGKAIEDWNSLSESEKLTHKAYKQVRDGITTLENLKSKSVMDTFLEKGIRFSVDENGNVNYYPADLVKLQNFIQDELLRLEVDMNVLNSLKLTDDLQAFLNPSETLPTYNTVSNVIWAMVDRSINSLKVNGKPFIQVASTFFDSGERKGAYKDSEGNWVTVNNQEEYNKAVEEGNKVVLTSSKLKFYTIKKGDTETSAMEILLPDLYKDKVNSARKAKGLSPLSDTELMDYLNSDPRLLEGIGFRIPTQATSSLEFFKIKGFLPKSFGSAVVVPSGITKKAGSDFDVDKLNTYLNNWKLGKNGLPIYEDFEEDPNTRYINFIKEKEEDYSDIYRNMKDSLEYKQRVEDIKDNSRLVSGTKDTIDYASDELLSILGKGGTIFRALPPAVKQQYYEKERELKSLDITGIRKVLEYKEFTEEWINQFSGNGALVLPFQPKKGGSFEVTVNSKEVLPILRELVDSQLKEIEARGLKQEIIDEYKEIKAKKYDENSAIIKNYELKLVKTIAEFNGLPSYEDFLKLPIHLQNTRGAVENKYFESIRNILKDPDRYEQLMSINTMENIKRNKDAVLSAIDENYKKAKKTSINYSNFLDINYLTKKRQAFVKGKFDIGIFAIGMTNFANSQVVGLGITEGGVNAKNEWIMNLNNNEISLPFTEVKTLTVNGYEFIPLSNSVDAEGKFVMDKLSGYVNGAVDVAKEPNIVEMGMHTLFAGSYLVLERTGLSGEMTALFLYQPVIREYLKELIFLQNQEFGFTNYKAKKDLVNTLLDKYGKNAKYKHVNFSKDQLINMIRKGEQIRLQQLSETPVKNPVAFTDKEKYLQYLAFVNFLKIDMYAQDLRKVVDGSNHDTSKIRSAYSLFRKDFIASEQITNGSSIHSPINNGFNSGVKAIREKTFIGKTVSTFKLMNDMFSNINLFVLQRKNPKKTLHTIAKKTLLENPYMSADDFDKFMKEVEVSMIDSLLNNKVTRANGVKLNAYFKSIFSPAITEGDTIKYANNIHNTFEKIKRDFPGIYATNEMLQNLQINLDPKLDIYTIEFKNLLDENEVLSRNLIIQGWKDLHTSKHPEINKFAELMDIASIVQYGMKYQRKSTSQFIPMESYSQLIDAAFSNIDNEDFSLLNEEVVRSNGYKGFVKEEQPFDLRVVDDNGKITKRKSSKISYDSKRPTSTERVYFHNKETVKPTFFWRGYLDDMINSMDEEVQKMPQFVYIKMVKPEYVINRFDEDTNEVFKGLSPKALQMMKRQDFSFLYNQLFKLVGSDGTTPIVYNKRKSMGGKNKGRVNVEFLYKPVNSTGYYSVNEIVNLKVDDAGNVLGKPSALKVNLPINEETDEAILNRLMLNKNAGIGTVNYVPIELSNEEQQDYVPDAKVREIGYRHIDIKPKDLPDIEPSCE